jgi:tRNA G10  N-methylase Trm11
MKKHYYLFSLAIVALSFSAYASTNNKAKKTQSEITLEQKVQSKNKKENAKYDFSLFKFITPKKSTEQDSTIKSEESQNEVKREFENETTDLFDQGQKPRSFFKFSYAS